MDYLILWDLTLVTTLTHRHEDTFEWPWEASGLYSSRSAYRALYFGSVRFACAEAIWDLAAPLKCKCFMRLAVHRRCWTADCLKHRGLQNQGHCIFCLAMQESIDHLLVGCAVTSQIWPHFFRGVGLHRCLPVGQSTLKTFGWQLRRLLLTNNGGTWIPASP